MQETENSGTFRHLPPSWALALTFCAALGVGCHSHHDAPRETGEQSRVLYYVDPMHPAYRSNKPGKAPDCGMELTPVYAQDNHGNNFVAAANQTLHLTPGQEQAIRLETETVSVSSTPDVLHTVGRVAPDEASTYRVSAGADGWVRQVFSDRTGMRVNKGEPLAAFYSKDISAPQQAYLYALESWERLKQSNSPPGDSLPAAAQQLATARDNLAFLGMDKSQLEQLGRTRRELSDVNLTAPANGYVLERHVSVGQRFAKGDLLYRIADLQHVWIMADVYSGDAPLLGSVTRAHVRVEGMAPLEAHIANALPEFDPLGRVGVLRIEVKNPTGAMAPLLVPGMLVNVDLDRSERSAMTVHSDAVIDSGSEKRVFVVLGNGEYELRPVETGLEQGDRVEIRSGLAPGDRVVTSGAFLLDSESRMRTPHMDAAVRSPQ
jgi:RND family efflux transporter MFP subunit